jgi:hypothetical protein
VSNKPRRFLPAGLSFACRAERMGVYWPHPKGEDVMTKQKIIATAALAALFSLGLAGAAFAQATPATPPVSAQKGQAMKDDKATKDKAAKDKKAQGQKKGMDNGKKTGMDKKKPG